MAVRSTRCKYASDRSSFILCRYSCNDFNLTLSILRVISGILSHNPSHSPLLQIPFAGLVVAVLLHLIHAFSIISICSGHVLLGTLLIVIDNSLNKKTMLFIHFKFRTVSSS